VSTVDCWREAQVISAIISGRWPHGVEDDLRVHAESGATCREVVDVASILRIDRLASADVPVPAAGQVWWRAAIRARAEQAGAAARPMIWLQAGIGAAAAGLAAAGVSIMWPRVSAMWVSPVHVATLQESLPFLLAIGVGVIAAPIAFYLAVPRD
jgi:hypothetical protein